MKLGIISGLALTIVAISVAAAPGGNKPPKPPAEEPLTPAAYYAANGARVGQAFHQYVVIRLEERIFPISVDNQYVSGDTTGAAWGLGGDLLYEFDGCVGVPFIESSWVNTRGYDAFGVVVYGETPDEAMLYVSTYDSGERNIRVESAFRYGGCADYGYDSGPVYPIVASYDMDAMFPLPLKIR